MSHDREFPALPGHVISLSAAHFPPDLVVKVTSFLEDVRGFTSTCSKVWQDLADFLSVLYTTLWSLPYVYNDTNVFKSKKYPVCLLC